MTSTSGVAAVGRILARLARCERTTVQTLIEENGLARSSAFSVVRRLEEAGLVIRNSDCRLVPGPEAARLGLSAMGLHRLLGPAEVVLRYLTDHIGVSASLFVPQNREAAVELKGPWEPRASNRMKILDESIRGPGGVVVAMLQVAIPSQTPAQEVAFARSHLSRARATLEASLRES